MKKQKVHNKNHKNKKYVGADASVCPKHQRNTQKGITLIALVITIIVLLILAVVSIRLVVNNGILGKAEHATQKYTEAEAAEQEKLLKAEYEMAKYEGKFSGTYTDYVLDKKFPGLKIGDKVDYNEGTVNQYEFTTDTTKGMGASATKNEETKKYDLTAGTYKTENLSWRVLGINDEGQIELISETPHPVKVALANEEGYYNGEEELDKLCNALYGKGTGAATENGARSLDVNDINKLANYDPATDTTNNPRYNTYRKYRFTSEGAYEYSDSTDGKTNWSDWTSIPSYYGVSSFTMIGETEPIISATKAGETEAIKHTYYYYNAKTKITSEISESVANLLVDSSNNQWLASSCVNAGSPTTNCTMFYLNSDGNIHSNGLYHSSGYRNSHACAVRPVVSLKSDIQLEYNSTAGEWQIQ